jgi:hypothetical protein
MAFAREFTEKEKAYIIEWQYAKTPGWIASDMNKWPENQDNPRTTKGVRNFLYRRRRQETPVQ